jgi:PEP-CTERM putative exosortase interaction domain
MKKTVKLAVLTTAICASSAWAAITINFAGVAFLDNNGNPLPDGALIQLIASTQDAVFSAPTSTAFTSGDDVIIASFIVSSASSGVAGGVVAQLDIADYSTYSASFNIGDPLAVRWYPSLGLGASAPGATTYGQYTSTSVLNGSDIAWLAPADSGGTYTLNLISTSFDGETPAVNLRASLTTSAIPEPSSFAALASLAMLGFAAMRKRRRA